MGFLLVCATGDSLIFFIYLFFLKNEATERTILNTLRLRGSENAEFPGKTSLPAGPR